MGNMTTSSSTSFPLSINVAVFASGRGSNLKALLDAKAAGKLERVRFGLVFSDVDNPKAFDYAQRHEIPTAHLDPKAYKTKKEFEKAVVALLSGKEIEWIVLAGYMRIVGRTLLDAFPNRIINIHPSLLPAFGGLYAQRQALDYGVKVTGCTVHFVDSGVDSGPIILQKTVPCYPEDNEAILSNRILAQEHDALPEALDLISRGKVSVRDRKVVIEETLADESS